MPTSAQQAVGSNDSDPFALGDLFSAGTIMVAVHTEDPPCHNAGSNIWRPLPALEPSNHLEGSLFRKLAFLADNVFVRTTCRLDPGGRLLFIRVYLIPDDSPERLRCRDEAKIKEGRRYLHSVLPLVSRSLYAWNADEPPQAFKDEYFLPRSIDNRTMAEIYNGLDSPVVPDHCVPLARKIYNGQPIWGLRSQLYDYQRRSVAVMIEKELSHMPVPDPLFVGVSGVLGERYYLQPSTMTILRERPMVSSSRGGILCEELGTGKTVMILGLILATIGQLPEPEEAVFDSRPVMTPLAYRHFDLPCCMAARSRYDTKSRTVSAAYRVPSLVELLLHHIRSSKEVLNIREFEDKLEGSHLWHMLLRNTPFYYHNDVQTSTDIVRQSSSRNKNDTGPRVMYLSLATLVVVPLTLLGQWDREVQKHCRSHVRYLIVRQSETLPAANVLATDYDVIVMSDVRFRKESTKKTLSRPHTLEQCTCPCFAGSRVPDCRCAEDSKVTPLLQIRWKRLVIDEGHISGNISCVVNHFVRQMSIERKWIVTGTPTSNILGLSLGRTSTEEDVDDPDFYGSQDPDDSVLCSEHSILRDTGGTTSRIWSRYDSENLRKLGTMIGGFLAVPQFHADRKAFAHHVSLPLCDRRGPRPMAMHVLRQVMQMVMVRHRVEDVEQDVCLPPMKHEVVYMDLSEYALQSYNALQAGIVINAVDSERRDQDYLFHPSKAKELQNAMDNLSQVMFWSASDILYNVDQICNEADSFRARALKRQVPKEDFELLQSALAHAAAAASDKLWRAMQRHEDVPFKVTGLGSDIFEAWTRGKLKTGSRKVDLMHPNRLIELRAFVLERPLISKKDLIYQGTRVNVQEGERLGQKASQPGQVPHVDQVKRMAEEVKEGIKALKDRQELAYPSECLESAVDVWNEANKTGTTSSYPGNVQFLAISPLSGVRVGPSLSTKLNYILSQAVSYSTEEKFLVFSKSALTLAHVAEGLSLFGIKHLRYTSDMHHSLREQFVMTFESSDTYRVFLIELKLGARGLNLVSASRVIFCEPVWHPDVESQAIKRAHRIGQERRIIVKTLVIRSTAEEAMLARRQYLESHEQIPKMTIESGMRSFIENPRFLDSASSEPECLTIPLIAETPDNMHPTSDLAVDIDANSVDNLNYTEPTSERKKARTTVVRFA